METLYFLGGLLWAILSIIVIVKFFQMSSDLRALKKHFIPNAEECNTIPTYDPAEEVKGAIKTKGVKYTIKNDVATFSDGKVGLIMFYPHQTKWSFRTDDFVSDKKYADVYYAAEALYDHLNKK